MKPPIAIDIILKLGIRADFMILHMFLTEMVCARLKRLKIGFQGVQ
jgi:hypothetical protein